MKTQGEQGDLISAYYRRLTHADPNVQKKAAQAWSTWECATSKLFIDQEMLAKAQNNDWAVKFARIEWFVVCAFSGSVGRRVCRFLFLVVSATGFLFYYFYYFYFCLLGFSHYFVHGGFFESDSHLLDNVHKIRHIPTTIVQGRYDIVCPMTTAWDLHKVGLLC